MEGNKKTPPLGLYRKGLYMTDQEKCEYLTEHGMGWGSVSARSTPSGGTWVDSVGNIEVRYFDWSPLTDLSHAMMVVEKICPTNYYFELTYIKRLSQYQAMFVRGKNGRSIDCGDVVACKLPATVVSNACIEFLKVRGRDA